MTEDGTAAGRRIGRAAARRWATLALGAALGAGVGVRAGAQVVGRPPDPTRVPVPGLAPTPRLPPAPGRIRRHRMDGRHGQHGPRPRLGGWAWVPICAGPVGSTTGARPGANDAAAPPGVVPAGDPTALPRYTVPTYTIPSYAIPHYTPAPAPTAVGVTSASRVLCDGGAVYWVAEPRVTRRAPDHRERPPYPRRPRHRQAPLPPITRNPPAR